MEYNYRHNSDEHMHPNQDERYQHSLQNQQYQTNSNQQNSQTNQDQQYHLIDQNNQNHQTDQHDQLYQNSQHSKSHQYSGFTNQHPYETHYQAPGDIKNYETVRVASQGSTTTRDQLSRNTYQRSAQVIPQTEQPVHDQYFNDESYYSSAYNLHQPVQINDGSNNGYYDQTQDTHPILDHSRDPYTSQLQPISLNQYEYGYDLENQSDFVDQRGDDYQINSYLNKDGEMVNPYSSTFNLDEYGQADDMSYDVHHSSHSLAEPRTNSNESIYDNDDNTIMKLESSTNLLDNDSYDGEEKHNDLGEKRLARKSTVLRKFKLCEGNFIFDCPISEHLITQYYRGVDDQNKLSNEFKFMRYQAVTCQPVDFQIQKFTLRQLKYMVPRKTELMIVVTMYNEDEILLGRTLKGAMDNIKHFTKRSKSSTWGSDAWKKICLCIVSDGRTKIHERSLALLSALGCYQDGFAKDEINEKKVVAHVYEHTTKVNIAEVTEDKISLACGENTVPVQLLFCLKEQNQKKINSHRWAFEAFAEVLQANVVILLDAGTMPGKDSIYELWKEFRNPQVGGACGEIRTDLGNSYSKLLNPLVAAQNFEYKMSNILDKTTESNFGFITVLPGAFSAYRFEAIKGEPLRQYFMGDDLNAKVFISNMYLAEDRILCFEIVTKKDSNWVLKYCRASYGSTDVPEGIPEFILQRRRWLNGSFFAALYSFLHFYKVWTSGHSIARKFLITIEFLYLFLSTTISWFSLSSFFLVFRILTLSIAISYDSQKIFRVLSVIFLWLYGISILITFILSLGNKPKGTATFYLCTFVFFAILMVYMMFCAIFMSVHSVENIVKEGNITFHNLLTKETFRDLLVSMASTYCLYFLSSIVYLQPMHMMTSFIQYLLLSPSYVNVLNIYAFCNVHDISWGTKGAVAKPLGKIQSKEDGTVKMEIPVSSKEIEANYNKYKQILSSPKPEEPEEVLEFDEKKASYYALIRSLVIIAWIISNFIIIAVVLETGGLGQYQDLSTSTDGSQKEHTVTILSSRSTIYFSVVLWLVAFMAAIRFIGCCLYMLKRILSKLRFS